MSTRRATIRIDGTEHTVDPGRNLLEVALQLGYDLPYFCWHPELGSVGACRQCAATQYADDRDARGRVVMACMTPCADGARFSLDDAQAEEMRRAVIEFLMTNHPHDCPVCEEGGNCHLQDMTLMAGHSYRRYRHTKRSHRNQDLGPFVGHEMNRCIACYRCVRYYRDYAGGEDLNVFGAHNHVYFGRAEDGTLESPFAGNLVEICPTGVFTDKPYGETYTRKWDLQQAPSICAHCAVGCNVMPGERYGLIKRIENRYNGSVNGYFLCDRGRYGHAYANDAQRPRQARLNDAAVSPRRALRQLADWLQAGDVAGIGSPRASIESNHALQALLGADNVHRGLAGDEAALDDAALALLREVPVEIADLRQIEAADAALVLGEDVGNTAPRLELALRQMTRNAGFAKARQAHIPEWQDQSVRLVAQDERSPLFVATPAATALDPLAAAHRRATPAGIARLGYAVAHALDSQAPKPKDLDADSEALAGRIATSLRLAERPLLVSGTGCRSLAVVEAAAAVAHAYHQATTRRLGVCLGLAEANSLGTALLGGPDLDRLCERVEKHGLRTLVVLENDLNRRLPPARLHALLDGVENLVVIDHLPGTLARAALALPAATVFEGDGTFVSHTGRAQRFVQVFMPEGDQRESWCWLQHAARLADRDLGLVLDDLTRACAAAHPALAGIVEAAPGADFRLGGSRIPRQPHRYSGRTAMHAHRDIHEPRPAAEPDSAFSYSMEGAATPLDKPAAALPIVWAPRWNSPQAVHKFQDEIGGPLRGGDPGVPLLAPPEEASARYGKPPAAARKLITVPLHHIFGSEELSALAPAVQQRGLPGPYVAVHPDTAKKLGLGDGRPARLAVAGLSLVLPVAVREDLHPKTVGLPLGVTGVAPGLFGRSVELETGEEGA